MRYEVRVNLVELEEQLKRLRKAVKRKTKGTAAVSYRDGVFTISLDNVDITASAEGSFPGVASLPGINLLRVSKELPHNDPLTFAYEDGRLWIEKFSLPCSWST